MSLKLPSTILLLLCSIGLYAQSTALKGRVTDESGVPLVGVVVQVKGDAMAAPAVTDFDGQFTISTTSSSAQALVFSILSYETKEVPIGKQTFYSVVLKEEALMLEETVVVGYGTMIRRELTSSIASVSNEKLNERASALNIAQSMAGKMAGVQAISTTGRPGGGMNLTVRGLGSISASTEPLYVVDGVVDVDPTMINPADIEKIDVLKDAASSAMYGARGSNGVVMVTTKAGRKDSGTVTFDSKTGVNYLARRLNTMDSETWLAWARESYAYSGQYMPHLLPENADYYSKLFNYRTHGDGSYALDENGCLLATPIYDTNWFEEVTQTGIVTDNTVSFTQGNDQIRTYASLGYQNVDGTLKTTYSKKYSATIKLDANLAKWLDLRTAVTAGKDITNANDNEGTMMNGASRMIYEMIPILPVTYPDGTPSRYNDYFTGEEPKDNSITQLEGIYNVTENTNILANAGLDWHLSPKVILTTTGSYYIRDSKNNYFARKGIFNWSTNENVASVTNKNIVRWTNEDYLTYSDTFFMDKLKSTFVLGTSFYSYLYEDNAAKANSISSEVFKYHNLGAGTTKIKPSSGYDKQTMNSYYFRTNQVLLGKYMFGMTLRVDGASVFGANKKYGFFPSASAAWNISEEPWFESAKSTVNNLKFRLSYGLTGNSGISSYKSLATFKAGTAYFAGKPEATQVLGQLANGDLSWESAGQFDAGLDIALFNNRVQIVADFYLKDTYDLLYELQVPYTTGYASSLANCAQLRNRGFEFTMNTYNIDHKNFKWDTDFIFSTNKTIVKSLGGIDCIDGGTTMSVVGEEWQRWYLPNRLGVWQLDEVEEAAVYGAKPGDIKYEDIDGDGVFEPSTDDRRYVGGTARPRYELSMVNTFFWKGFTFSIDLGSLLGYKSMSTTQSLTEMSRAHTNSTYGLYENSWRIENPNTRIPVITGQKVTYKNSSTDEYFVTNGDFLRIRNISLIYDFKRNLMKNSKFFKGLLFGINVENAYLWTKYSGGIDPECAWASLGWDWFAYPRPMTITANIKLSF